MRKAYRLDKGYLYLEDISGITHYVLLDNDFVRISDGRFEPSEIELFLLADNIAEQWGMSVINETDPDDVVVKFR